MGKTGLIVEGGGMKCAYHAAILDRFLDDQITFDYGIGVSAGAANLASFLAGQRERNMRYFTIHVKDPNYLGITSFLRTGQVFGLQYIYRTMSNSDGVDPIDFPALMSNPCEYQIVATNAATGEPEYLDKSLLAQDDYWPLMATCAIPIVCRPVTHNGVTYVDGGVSDSIPVGQALRMGCDKIVVILTKPRGFIKKPQSHKRLYHMLLHKYPAVSKALDRRHIMYMEEIKQIEELEAKGSAFILQPAHEPDISTYTKDPVQLRALYDTGLADYETKRNDLLKFMGR